MFKFLILFSLTLLLPRNYSGHGPDRICGKWISEEKNLIVQIYKDEGLFKAKIVWFKNTDKSRAMDEWTDLRNPNPELRSRKIIGLGILRNLTYVSKSDSWEDGKIYDALHGHEWDASAYINKEEELKVTGYWHFKFFGRTLTFTRM